jgi:hypothetical protein
MDFAAGADRYPAPDWKTRGTVARVWVPDDETVGWLIFQEPDRLAWLSAAAPETLGYTIREIVEEILRDRRVEDAPAVDAWEEILSATLHETPTPTDLPALLAEVRNTWN